MQAMLTVKLTVYFEPWRVPGLRVRERRGRTVVGRPPITDRNLRSLGLMPLATLWSAPPGGSAGAEDRRSRPLVAQ